MNALVSVLLVILISISHSINVHQRVGHSAGKLSRALRNIDKGEFGHHLIETISLKMKLGGDVDAVIKMLKELKSSLELEDTTDQKEFRRKEFDLKQSISNDQKRVSSATIEADEAGTLIQTLQNKEDSLRNLVAINSKQLELLKAQRTSLKEIHTKDQNQYTQRIQQQKNMIQVLSKIIKELKEKVLNQQSPSLTEVKEVLSSLYEIADANPISALVELTSTFDPGVIKTIITKLEQIMKGLQASLDEDKRIQERSDNIYKEINSRIEALEDRLVNEKAAAERELKSMESQVIIQKEQKATSQTIAKRAQAAITGSENQLMEITNLFNQRSKQRSESINLIDQAIQILIQRTDI